MEESILPTARELGIDIKYLYEAGRKFSVKGARYTEEGMKGINA